MMKLSGNQSFSSSRRLASKEGLSGARRNFHPGDGDEKIARFINSCYRNVRPFFRSLFFPIVRRQTHGSIGENRYFAGKPSAREV